VSDSPKAAALLAAARESVPEAPLIRLDSRGVVLVYGRDQAVVEAAALLQDQLDVTVLVKSPAALTSLPVTEFPVAKGVIRAAKGYLGAFELTVDDFAPPAPSAAGMVAFGAARDGAVSRCDIVLDLSGGASLFAAPALRDGYLRADPGSPHAVAVAVSEARELVGSFDKPQYIAFSEHLCAHSRSRIVGCRRCLDLCPAGAIAPNGDHVVVDSYVCAGCGQCAAACPTGAVAYTVPPADVLMRKLRVLLLTYRDAGGEHPVVLLHDRAHGQPLLDALAESAADLPENVLPLCVNEVTQVGLESFAALFAYGASAARVLTSAKPRCEPSGLSQTLALTETILGALGLEGARLSQIETDDPEVLPEALRAIPPLSPVPSASTFLPSGDKRSVLRFALQELQRVAPSRPELVPLPAGAPFGNVEIDTAGCTLCLSCVSACPTGALGDDPERPVLRFSEDACVQCGLCKATCPEKVITLEPRLSFARASSRVLKEETPFCCIRCGKPFAVRSSVERVIAALEGKHWMFKDAPERLDLVRMCDSCRVAFVTEREFDPHARMRAPVRTTDDYLRERKETKKSER
jgi:Fe-S-cluster-containing hydrogenase component 2